MNIKRILKHGELKFVLLYFIQKNPSHGYDLIKSLEELSHGTYSPSPGVIYPSLAYLEDFGFTTSSLDENKKLYKITPLGKEHLKNHHIEVLEMIENISKLGKNLKSANENIDQEQLTRSLKFENSPIRKSMHLLKASLFPYIDSKQSTKVKISKIIDNAIAEIKQIKP